MLSRLAVAAVVLAALPAASLAQDQQPPAIRFSPGTMAVTVSGSGFRRLLQRDEVKTHLALDIKQKAALDDLFGNKNQQRVAVSIKATPGDNPDDLRKQAEEQVRAQIGGVDAKVKEILRPEQYARLIELDAQWRGALALADAAVAKRVGLNQEHAAKVGEIAARYAAQKQQVLASLAQTNEQASPDGSKRMVMTRIDTSKLDNKLSPEYRQLSAAKREAETQILGVLSSDERERWQAAQGKPFVFRDDHPGQRL